MRHRRPASEFANRHSPPRIAGLAAFYRAARDAPRARELASMTRIAYDALRHRATQDADIATSKFLDASLLWRSPPLLCVALAACASGDDPAARPKSSSAIGARLQPIAGGVGHGLITFQPYDGGLRMVADVGGFSSGWYRIAIHMTPICTSPNGFSAGPPFVLPGTSEPVVVPIRMWEQGTATLSTRVPGLDLDRAHGDRRQVHRVAREHVRVARHDARGRQRSCRVRRDRRRAHALLKRAFFPMPDHGPPPESRWAFSPARRS